MMNNPHPIRDYLVPGKRVHLVGIGGVSMCPLAEVLRGMGLTVQGSDMTESDTVKHLRSLGIQVAIGHNAENLGDCDLVVRTAAVHDSNPEIAGAVARASPFTSVPRPGAPSCSTTPTPCASPAPTARPRPLPCAPTFSWPLRRTPRS